MSHENLHYIQKTMKLSYYQNVREDLAEFVAKGNNRVLDVGCGAGYFGAFLKEQGRATFVIGVEIDAIAVKEAAIKLDHVLCANLNMVSINDILGDFEQASFDYIICADVLEHLIDPWSQLAELVAFLKPGGMLVISLPNVRHWSVWLPLILRGHWEYRASGIMDKTHLRFFTKQTAQRLVDGPNLEMIQYRSRIWRKSEKILNIITLGIFEDFLASQWVLVGHSK